MASDDILSEIKTWATRLRFAEIVANETKRTYVVPTSVLAVELEALIAAHGIEHLAKVIVSPWLPDGTAVMMDEQALEAGTREAINHMGRPWVRNPGAP